MESPPSPLCTSQEFIDSFGGILANASQLLMNVYLKCVRHETDMLEMKTDVLGMKADMLSETTDLCQDLNPLSNLSVLCDD